MHSRGRGLFVVLEGPDKSGKSTQARLLMRWLKRRRRPALHTREPGGTGVAEGVRQVLLSTKSRIGPLAELFLYEAARAQHTEETIRPALSAGKVVVSERYTMSTTAYQGFGRGLPLPLIRSLNRTATGGLEPDLTVVIDIPDRDFAGRDRRRRLDRLERESSDFRRRVRDGYRRLSRARGVRLIDGTRAPEDVHERIASLLEPLL